MVDFKRRSHNKLLPGDRCYLICCDDSDGLGMQPRDENLLRVAGIGFHVAPSIIASMVLSVLPFSWQEQKRKRHATAS